MEQIKSQLDILTQRTIMINVVALVCIGLLSWTMILFISESISSPIRELQAMTEKVGQGDFEVRVNDKVNDELQNLSVSFNAMVAKVSELMDDVKTEQENIKLMELKLLQAQINPHFLYNTLDTIVWLAETKNHEEVIKMVKALSNFFRTTLSKGRDYITVGEEIEHVKSYLEIQSVRYRDILDYEIEIPEELKDFMILKLSLQPLVENALYHGIKRKRGKGHIKIIGEYTENTLELSVIDNGMGMSEKRLEEVRFMLQEKIVNEESGGFGLMNVSERIKLNYGIEYGLLIESEENKGTSITIQIPLTEINKI